MISPKRLEERANSLHKAGSEGQAARRNGLARDDNPYPPGSSEQALWDDGWVRADIFS
jgi:hypothetical protein